MILVVQLFFSPLLVLASRLPRSLILLPPSPFSTSPFSPAVHTCGSKLTFLQSNVRVQLQQCLNHRASIEFQHRPTTLVLESGSFLKNKKMEQERRRRGWCKRKVDTFVRSTVLRETECQLAGTKGSNPFALANLSKNSFLFVSLCQ